VRHVRSFHKARIGAANRNCKISQKTVLVNLMMESRKAAKSPSDKRNLAFLAALRERIFFLDQIDHHKFPRKRAISLLVNKLLNSRKARKGAKVIPR